MIVALQTLIYFRASLISALGRLLQPYYNSLVFSWSRKSDQSEEDDDEIVFAEFDDEKGVVFFPAMYVQRYAAVTDCLLDERWHGKLEKVVDFGYHDMSYIRYLKDVPGVHTILGVDLESLPLKYPTDVLGYEDPTQKRESPLYIILFQGNSADPDFRLIGSDAVVSIEMIEHMLPHDLERFVHTVFGFIKPWIAVITTPNADFNVLFKSLGENGLRRWDHLFEWTREQFNDWCSNIVVRYPQYTVICEGIGPGPPGTQHHGCCSQLALFVCTDYQKQQELNMNSLALVSRVPSPEQASTSDVIGELDIHSFTQIGDNASGHQMWSTSSSFSNNDTVKRLLALPAPSTHSVHEKCFTDKAAQCNLDSERGKSYMMFDNDPYVEVIVPSKNAYIKSRVYEIGDVASRLNCSTLQATKFSENTMSLMAKNQMVPHAREVVDEIRHLTAALNFNKDSKLVENNCTWNNINWGENAPYWNQYYKVVQEFRFPPETKLDENRVLDLMAEEMSRLMDAQYSKGRESVNRVEVPLDHLMTVVQHITHDVEWVRDVLEWNGYEIENDMVIYSRPVMEAMPLEEDCVKTDSLSDRTTKAVPSKLMSEEITVVRDANGALLRRVLDNKVRDLRTIYGDKEMSSEMDKVVCRLMKLALSNRGHQAPLSTRWLQCKLLDLLTLTEKAIEKRRNHSVKEPGRSDDNSDQTITFERIMNDNTGNNIVDRYYDHLLSPSCLPEPVLPESDDWQCSSPKCILEEDTDSNKDELTELIKNGSSKRTINITDDDIYNKAYPNFVSVHRVFSSDVYEVPVPLVLDKSLQRTQSWVDEDVNAYNYSEPDDSFRISSETTDTDICMPQVNYKQQITVQGLEAALCISSAHVSSNNYESKDKHDKIKKKNKRNSMNELVSKNFNTLIAAKNFKTAKGVQCDDVDITPDQKSEEHLRIYTKSSKPIPESLINLCETDFKDDKGTDDYTAMSNMSNITDEFVNLSENINIAPTKEDQFIEIISIGGAIETIALRRTIGTDAEPEFDEAVLTKVHSNQVKSNFDNVSDVDANLYTKHQVSTEDVQAQTIFLNDINEPSTSNGIRHHVSMDVQCGPDLRNNFPPLTPSKSFSKLPHVFSTCIKIEEKVDDDFGKRIDFGTSTITHNSFFSTELPAKSIGIKIKDSELDILSKDQCYNTMKQTNKNVSIETEATTVVTNIVSIKESVLKSVPSASQTEDSTAEYYGSESPILPSLVLPMIRNQSNSLVNTDYSNDINTPISSSYNDIKDPLSNLRCGGVYVHSYKGQYESEDIVFQGDWQRYRAKPAGRKKPGQNVFVYNEPLTKKRNVLIRDTKANLTERHVPKRPAKCSKSVPLRKKNMNLSTSCVTNIKPVHNPVVNNAIVAKTDTKISTSKTRLLNRPKPNFCKVVVKKTSSGSKISKPYIARKPTQPKQIANSKGGDGKQILKDNKDNIPYYLKRNKGQIKKKSDLNKSLDSSFEMKQKIQEQQKDLLNFPDTVRDNLSYLVFYNELQETFEPTGRNSDNVKHDVTNDSESKGNLNISVHSLPSINSSTCSSTCSIASVRIISDQIKNKSKRKRSVSPQKSNYQNNDCDNATSTKAKRVAKRCKSAKINDNKENFPKNVASYKDTDKINKRPSPIIIRRKSFTVDTKIIANSTSLHSAQNDSKMKVKSLTLNKPENTPKLIIPKTRTSSPISKNRPSKTEPVTSAAASVRALKENSSQNCSKVCSNTVLILQPQRPEISPQTPESNLVAPLSDPQFISNKNDCYIAISEMVEGLLDFVDDVGDLDRNETLKSDNCDYLLSKSQTYDSIDNNSCISNDTELTGHRTFAIHDESNEKLIKESRENEFSTLSFESLTSASRFSEYFLAGNETIQSTDVMAAPATEPLSENEPSREVCDSSEGMQDGYPDQEDLNETLVNKTQSSDGQPLASDEPDSIAEFDSETGSPANGIASAVFVSRLSSDSYHSAEDIVPNWLFQMINAASSDEDEPETVEYGPIPEPLVDENGNPLQPPLGVGTGAGDGHGIHSDQSQDSSGRGSSLGSSSTTSGTQSEDVILIDPSALTAQFELLRETSPNTAARPRESNQIDSSDSNLRLNVTGERMVIHEARLPNPLPPQVGASDIDADISSLDTDIPDSS